MATRLSLADKIREREKEEALEQKEKVSTVKQLSANDGAKDKQISAKVNGKTYALFMEINKAQGISNNSALNLIISRYVRENKGIIGLDD